MIANKPSKEAEPVCYAISSFYLNKNQGDYKAAEIEVESLRISNLTVEDNTVTIFLSRPGLLIGRKGINIENLQKAIGRNIKIVESFNWNDILVPVDYEPFDYL